MCKRKFAMFRTTEQSVTCGATLPSIINKFCVFSLVTFRDVRRSERFVTLPSGGRKYHSIFCPKETILIDFAV